MLRTISFDCTSRELCRRKVLRSTEKNAPSSSSSCVGGEVMERMSSIACW